MADNHHETLTLMLDLNSFSADRFLKGQTSLNIPQFLLKMELRIYLVEWKVAIQIEEPASEEALAKKIMLYLWISKRALINKAQLH